MYFKQLVKEDLGCASYLVGCPDAAVCAVVDPRIDMVEDILELVAARGMRITAVIETHLHADHLSGHRELARRTGATIYVHELAGVAYPHTPLKDGDELWCGVVKLRVLHTPGHRPEHIALAVSDTNRSDEPWLVLTGDSLFIGDVARPDLAVAAEAGAEALYESIFERLLHLDDGVEVYPAHVAGSLCGRTMSAKTSSTIGFERKHNPAVAPRPRTSFIADLTGNLPPRPPNMRTIVARNRSGSTHLPAPLIPPLDAQSVQRELEHGALVLDTRSPEQFSEAHIPGAVFVSLYGPAFANRVGFVAPPDARLVLVIKDERDLHEAVQQLAVVGYDQVVGFLQSGMGAWQEAGLPVQQLSQLSVEELARRRHALTILDVRDQGEWDERHITGALHLPYYAVERQVHELDRTQPLAVICASGQRSMIASALLQRHGFTAVANVLGGMEAWDKVAWTQAERAGDKVQAID
jgi:hydroxyacylglutathione hydrolase